MDYSAKIIEGKKLAENHAEILRRKIAQLKVTPKIVSIIVGEDAPSVLYTQIKGKKAKEVGIDFEAKFFPSSVSFEDVTAFIEQQNADSSANGILIQLPVPEECLQGRNVNEMLEKISPQKDIDGLTKNSKFLPAAVRAVLSVLEDENIPVSGKRVVVVGASDLVGKPVAKELKKLGGQVVNCNDKTVNLAEQTRKAEILVSATGVPRLITGNMVSEGVVVIDVGAEKVGNKVVGDIDFNSVAPKASKITPVPGGVGPMTVVSLMENVVEVALQS